MWNSKSFKANLSPHEFVQLIANESKETFKISKQSEPIQVLSFLFNYVDRVMKKSKQFDSSVVSKFKGKVMVETFTESTEGGELIENGFYVRKAATLTSF